MRFLTALTSIARQLMLLLLVVGAVFFCLKLLGNHIVAWERERDHARRLGLVPSALRVTDVLYSSEKGMGFGPGANEAGIVLYRLPATIAEKVEREGLEFLAHAPMEPDVYGRRRAEFVWRKTPISLAGTEERRRFEWEGRIAPQSLITAYVTRYLIIDIDPRIERMVDDALSRPGNYYAFGLGGSMVIVIPGERRVVAAYAG